jgi:lipopolysaccharide biosynthesis protein
MNKIRTIAIYLPQYHSIPENDKAWGEGFTEWDNVRKAVPIFEGHYQPHVPHETVGYYDLSDPEVLVRQASMAREHGIYGFAFYHYWFNGKRLLEKPLDNMLASKKPDFPFCYIWANENWSKRWDGTENELIIRQEHSQEDNIDHITFLCKNVFSDHRYIKIDNKPLFLIYRTEIIPDIENMVKTWKRIAREFGFLDLYLVRVDNVVKNVNPKDLGFNAILEFGPDFTAVKDSKIVNNYNVINYEKLIEKMIAKEHNYLTFNCVFPGWDNSPRRKNLRGSIFINNDPDLFKLFMNSQIINTLKRNTSKEEQLLFINAWNEWGEGCHIEPDMKNGYTYLEICKETLCQDSRTYYDFVTEKYIEQVKKIDELEKTLKFSIKLMNFSIGRIIIRLTKILKRKYSSYK